MGDEASGPSRHSPPSPSSSSLSQKNNLAMLYYGLVVVGTAAVILALYNFLIIRWCARRSSQRQRPPASGDPSLQTADTSQSFQLSSGNLLESSSFKYKKELNNNFSHDMGGGDYEHECSVCLSVFEEGEEVRRLPRCNHSFHALCIDMWLYSHHDCPLCRAIVHIPPPPPHRNSATVDA